MEMLDATLLSTFTGLWPLCAQSDAPGLMLSALAAGETVLIAEA